MADTKVDRVAKAIWKTWSFWGPPIRGQMPAWDQLGDNSKDLARRMAVAAIEEADTPQADAPVHPMIERAAKSKQTN